jgi:hypothetical protein
VSPKNRKKAAKDKRDRRNKKEKNLKDPPKEENNLKDPPPGDLFDASFKANWTDKANWPLPASSNPLENIARPATRSYTSRLSQLQRESGRTVTSTPTPVDTASCKSEIKSESSDNLTTGKEKDNKGKLATYLSAASGSSSGGSSGGHLTRSEDSKYTYKYTLSSGDETPIPFFQPFQEATPIKGSPIKQGTRTGTKMASPDQDLEFVIIDIMGFTLTHPVGLALPQSYVLTFEEFRSI